ncbi:hypothetical protein ATE84_3400 [Aquimarina sp. MAR_2010_214]|uniref:hypothetical protein n=1 Tax=Aquimarina sp. MAR_2010_214 TaxID=1250026 RepID=UPI000CBE5BB1|nr:hypothetical protein [Aquimarina sp. MAR_2010_214]PKV51325.1 hypothetical protein ATE84_3400 [Aquimarina sp. MAR_2010_214]
MKNMLILCLPIMLYILSCKEDGNSTGDMVTGADNNKAEIISVEVTGEEGKYSFSVGIKSPDTGCNQYANWWEVISEDGELLYRRILGHSHVSEQPFVRSGGPVPIKKDQIVYVRAHMNTSKYGNKVFKGNVSEGFVENVLDSEFANDLEIKQPLPDGCAF